MRIQKLMLLTLLLPIHGHANFEAHEWGTFTSLVGSNGITQNGMYHEDEHLPSFVHGFGVTQSDLRPIKPPTRPCRSKGCFGDDFFQNNVVTQKMETPVIYFYTDSLKRVEVNVRFPEGVITETYPAPVSTSPTRGNIREVSNGNTTFQVDVLPGKSGAIPNVEPGNIYGHARNVNSNLVSINNELEKFIFYRGIGRFQPKLQITSREGNLALKANTRGDVPLAAFLVYVPESTNQEGQLLPLNASATLTGLGVSKEQIQALKARRIGYSGNASRGHLVKALANAGLHLDEAEAMISTWESGYLKVPGLRVLYVLPQAEADEVLPLRITPAPDRLERVFVGRIEVLLDTEEQEHLANVLRDGLNFQVKSLGRFAEPILRRLLEVYLGGGAGSAPTLANRRVLETLIQRAASEG